MVSQMSEQSRSVANDLLRLEAQLSWVRHAMVVSPVLEVEVSSTTSGSVGGVPRTGTSSSIGYFQNRNE